VSKNPNLSSDFYLKKFEQKFELTMGFVFQIWLLLTSIENLSLSSGLYSNSFEQKSKLKFVFFTDIQAKFEFGLELKFELLVEFELGFLFFYTKHKKKLTWLHTSSSKIVSILHSQFHKENEMKPQTFF
jgi:hypothetical protein